MDNKYELALARLALARLVKAVRAHSDGDSAECCNWCDFWSNPDMSAGRSVCAELREAVKEAERLLK